MKPAQIAVITGTRTRERAGVITKALAALRLDLVLVGDCKTGVDRETRRYCRRTGVQLAVFKAHWDAHGKSAGPRRNAAMVLTAHAHRQAGADVYAFGVPARRSLSKGTHGTIKLMRRAHLNPKVL